MYRVLNFDTFDFKGVDKDDEGRDRATDIMLYPESSTAEKVFILVGYVGISFWSEWNCYLTCLEGL